MVSPLAEFHQIYVYVVFLCRSWAYWLTFSYLLQPGYYVKPVGPHSFSCQKLGQISVRIYSKDDVNEPFPSVLLSLSGEDGYRNNSITAAGGIFLFDNLFPGSFYLRPLLKVLRWIQRLHCKEFLYYLSFPQFLISIHLE